MKYQQNAIISKEMMETGEIDHIDRVKKKIARQLVEKIIDNETTEVGILLKFKEEWVIYPYIYDGDEPVKEYKIKATAYITEGVK